MPSALPKLQYLPCAGAGRNYMAPGGPVIAVVYNGIFLPRAQRWPRLSYQETGGSITLNFPTETGDLIYALCVA